MARQSEGPTDRPGPFRLGLVMLKTRFPRLVGDIGNPATFPFETLTREVEAATVASVVTDEEISPEVERGILAAAVELERAGASLITTSCGFAMEDTCTPSQALGQTPARGSPDGPPAAPQTGAPSAGASQPRWGSHPVNIRFSIPLLFRSYYITVVIGPERRSKERRAIERQKHPLFTLGNVIVYLLAGTGWGVALLTLFQLLTIYTLRNGSLVLGVSVGLLLFVGLIGIASLFLWRLFKAEPMVRQ